jgi:tetratricopeptide (TPR) repeat protein
MLLVSEATLRLVRGAVRSESFGLVRISGQAEPLMAYIVQGIDTRQAMRVLTPFVGRAQERTLLHDLLARAVDGEGQVVGIVGEPGMGKSRLLTEFVQQLQDTPVTVLVGHCRAYGHASPYLPVRDLVRQQCGLTETDPPETSGVKVHRTCQAVGLELEESAPYLLHLLGLPLETERLSRLVPEAIQDRTFTALRQLHLRRSQQQPLLLVVENLHWIDPTSEAYLASLVNQLAGAPLFLLTTYRPDYRPPWIEKSYVTQMTLPRLTRQDSLAMVRTLLPPERFPDALVQRLLATAEGNPFFLEELAQAVLEQDSTAADLSVPATIRDVLVARIDRLPAATRLVVRTAAVLGREVPLRVLTALWEGPGALPSHLQALTRLEFLYERPGMAEPVYVFKHVLTREVAYEGLLAAHRQALHAAAGQVLERLYAERLEEVVDQLAYHFARTAEATKAVAYLTRVAERAAGGFAYVEALVALQEALRHAEHLPAESRDDQIVAVVLRQAAALQSLARGEEAHILLLQEQPRLAQLQNPALAGPYYFQLGMLSQRINHRDQALQYLRRAIAEAERCGDVATMGKAYGDLARASHRDGQRQQGIAYGQQAVALLERVEEPYWLGWALHTLAWNYLARGDIARALEASARARAIGDAIGHRSLQCQAWKCTGNILADIGEWEAGVDACRRALALAPSPVMTSLTLGYLGYAYLEAGAPGEAIDVLEQALQHPYTLQSPMDQAWCTIWLSQAYCKQGDIDKAQTLALQSLAKARDAHVPYAVAGAQRALGRVAYARGALTEAEQYFRAALELYTAEGVRLEMGRMHLTLAEIASAQGQPVMAAQHVTEAYALFAAAQAPKYVERTAQFARELGVSLMA